MEHGEGSGLRFTEHLLQFISPLGLKPALRSHGFYAIAKIPRLPENSIPSSIPHYDTKKIHHPKKSAKPKLQDCPCQRHPRICCSLVFDCNPSWATVACAPPFPSAEHKRATNVHPVAAGRRVQQIIL